MPAQAPIAAELARLFLRYPIRWIAPALLCAVGATAYACLKPATWEASLTLAVRAEASGNSLTPGQFRDLSAMKTLQETLLEIAKSRGVLTEALRAVGPPPNAALVAGTAWPTPQDVDDFSDALKIVPPKGTEFGSTEVFYLKVQDKSADRACALAGAVADQMLSRFAKMRDDKAGSMVQELGKAVDISRAQRDESVRELGSFESRVGGDLAELRSLEQVGSGDGGVRKLTIELESELRQAEQAVRNLRELLDLLEPAQSEPTRLLATPNRLLESQPSLRRLKEGLVDAQLRTSQLLGNMSTQHPLVRAAIDAEGEVRSRLHAELTAAVTGIETELGPAEALVNDRQARLTKARARLDYLASLRAEYSSLNAETQSRTRQLEQAEKQLVDARAAQAGAAATSLVSRIDSPTAGSRPLGPGKSTIVGAGCCGGLLLGAGLLLLTVTPPTRPAAPSSSSEPRTLTTVSAAAA